jgi:hypothetical protein
LWWLDAMLSQMLQVGLLLSLQQVNSTRAGQGRSAQHSNTQRWRNKAV